MEYGFFVLYLLFFSVLMCIINKWRWNAEMMLLNVWKYKLPDEHYIFDIFYNVGYFSW